MSERIFSSTQRLPRVGLAKSQNRQFWCRCRRAIAIPPEMKLGHVRCRYCGHVHRVGIPPTFFRIECPCGKILTAPKKARGKEGRCPGCRQLFIVGKGLQEKTIPKVAHGGPIHFKCQCGQAHMAEGERAGETIRCFRCGQDAKIPLAAMAQVQTSSPSFDVEATDRWDLVDPYRIDDAFAILQISAQTPIVEIKTACRQIQSRHSREDVAFQQAQFAKDTLTKPLARLWYELLHGQLADWPLRSKWCRKHEKTIATHREAISLEKKMLFHRADGLWKKALSGWHALLTSETFWQAAATRGETLFGKKYKAKVIPQLREKILCEVVLAISEQFYQKHLQSHNLERARFHLISLEHALEYCLEIAPHYTHARDLLQHLWLKQLEELQRLGKTRQAKPLQEKLRRLRENS